MYQAAERGVSSGAKAPTPREAFMRQILEVLQLSSGGAGSYLAEGFSWLPELLFNLFGNMHLHFFAVDVENVSMVALDGDLRQLVHGNRWSVGIGVAVWIVGIFDKINHVPGFDGVVHGVFVAEQFRRNIGFRSHFHLRWFPVAILRRRRGRRQQEC